MTEMNFNANNVAPTKPIEAIPAGWYVVLVKATEKKPTKDGRGHYLQVSLEVVDGRYKGAPLFDRINLWNQNAKAADIAARQLSSLCHATGELDLRNSEQLHGKVVQAKVRVRPPTGEYESSNEIRAYRKHDGAASAPVAATSKPNEPSWSA